jgi:hypothetical protein
MQHLSKGREARRKQERIGSVKCGTPAILDRSPFGEMGTEGNGFFVHQEEQDENDDVQAGGQPLSLPPQPANTSQLAATADTNKPVKFALLKGRVPVKVSH